MPRPATLLDFLELQAAIQPDRIALTWLPEDQGTARKISFGELFNDVRDAGERLIAIGASQERVLLLLPQSIDYVVWFFACCYAGAIAVPLYPLRRSTAQRVQFIAQSCSARFAVAAADPARQTLEVDELAPLQWITTDEVSTESPSVSGRCPVSCDDIAYLQFTSGSTSQPRGVMITHKNALANIEDIAAAASYNEESVSVSWLPFFHDMGLVLGLLTPLSVGCEAVLMTPAAFVRDPYTWLSALHRYRGTHSGGPNFAYDLCTRKIAPEQRDQLRLESWRVACNGAEPIQPRTLRQFSEAFAPCGFKSSTFFPSYGLAEATLGVTGTHWSADHGQWTVDADAFAAGRIELPGGATRATTEVVSVGVPYGDTVVQIVDRQSSEVLPEKRIGELWVKGRSVAAGYWGLPEKSAETFLSHLANGGPGPYLRTGDLGAFVDGQLVIAGRSKDMIIVRGRNYYPQDIELTVEASHTAVRPHATVAFSEASGEGETLVVVAEISRHSKHLADQVLAGIRSELSSQHELLPGCICLVREGAIPKTTSGKLQRSKCKELFAAGSLPVIAESRGMQEDTGTKSFGEEGSLVALVARELGCSPGVLDVRQPLRAFGLDSLGSLAVQHAIEREFGVRIPAQDIAGKSIDDIAIECRGATRPRAASVPILQRHGEAFALSYGQQALWYLNRLDPADASYNLAVGMTVRGPLDVTRLQRALRSLLEKHACLRLRFRYAPTAEVLQYVSPVPDQPLVTVDGAASDMSAEANRPFDLEREGVFRAFLFQQADAQNALLLVIHHICADLKSLQLVFEHLGELYSKGETDSGSRDGAELYAQFVARQQAFVSSPEGKAGLEYWRKELSGINAALELPRPLAAPSPAAWVATRTDHWNKETTDRLARLARAHGVTLYVALLSVVEILLSRYAASEVVVCSPVSGRTDARFTESVGYFVNLTPLTAKIVPAMSFEDVLRQAHAQVEQALRWQDCPYSLIKQSLDTVNGSSGHDLLHVLFAYQQITHAPEQDGASFALSEEGGAVNWGDAVLESVALPRKAIPAPLVITAVLRRGGLSLKWEARLANLSQISLDRLASQFRHTLAWCLENPSGRLEELDILTREEVRMGQNASAVPVDGDLDAMLPVSFVRQALRTPGQTAIVHGNTLLTYADVLTRVQSVAHYLKRQSGILPEDRIGVLLPRTPDLVVSLLGILLSGGVYVPLDPRYPEMRNRYVCQDAGIKALLTVRGIPADFLEPGTPRMYIDDVLQTSVPFLEEDPLEHTEATADNLAYLIYTSGSTGKPKAVGIRHGSAMARMRWAGQTFSKGEFQRVAFGTSITFDLSVFEMFAPLLNGGSVRILDDVLELVGETDSGITLLNTVPSAAKKLVEAGAISAATTTVNLAGEALPADLVKALFKLPHVKQVLNLYGPSEDTTYSTCMQVQDGSGAPPIGCPLPGTQLYILDQFSRRVPAGVTGEIVLAGDGLARGYINRPGLTAGSFLPDPFSQVSGARMYRTGDLGRFREDGMVEYAGRIDHQVKLRGFRVELGEVEAQMRECPGVGDAVALARDDSDGTKVLVAFYSGSADEITAVDIGRKLSGELPGYMVPATFVHLEQIPLTANGKIDRKALAVIALMPPERESSFTSPREGLESTLAPIWSEVLGRERVGREDNFFEIGGHSLLAVRLVTRITQALGLKAQIRDIFECPTIADLALRLGCASTTWLPPIEQADRTEPLPLSYTQQRLWFLNQIEGGGLAYHLAGGFALKGPLKRAAFERAWQHVIERHEGLRTVFPTVDGLPVQQICPPDANRFRLTELELRSGATERHIRELMQSEADAPFDLAHGPCLRGTLLRLADDRHVLLIAAHHIILDGWSLPLFFRELGSLYNAFAHNLPSPLAPLAIQYADYAAWQRALADTVLVRQSEFWKQALDGAPALLELPGARIRPAIQDFRGETVAVLLDDKLTASVKAFAGRHAATPFMVLLAAWTALLARLSGQGDVVVGIPTANRGRIEIEGLIGLFVNTLPIRTRLNWEESCVDLIDQIRNSVLAAQENQDLPFEQIVQKASPARSLSHQPLFQTMFVWRDAPLANLHLDGIQAEAIELETVSAKLDIILLLGEDREGISGYIEYASALFDQPTIARYSRYFVRLLTAIVNQETARLGDLPLLAANERSELLQQWSGAEAQIEPGLLVHELIAEWAVRTPETPAVVCEDATISYRELNGRANQLACYLVAMGVQSEQTAAVCLPSGCEAIIALVAVLKSGAAYVPVHTSNPPDRLRSIIQDCQPAIILTQSRFAGLFESLPHKTVFLDSPSFEIACAAMPGGDPDPSSLRPERLAYVIFTSGSTGEPKGVMVSHENLRTSNAARRSVYGQYARFLLLSPLAFDSSIAGIFGTLTSGGCLVVPALDTIRDAARLIRLMEEQRIDTLLCVPSLYAHLLTQLACDQAPSLRRVILAGEELPASVVTESTRTLPRVAIFNEYGPTETTVWATMHPCRARSDSPIPIGRPVPSVRIYILNSQLQPVPVGITGEIYVGGAAVSRGYLRHPGLTASRFVPDAVSGEPGKRLYRTGDLARWQKDGAIDFLGRSDGQIKLRGFRIELGEIEAQIRQVPGVREAFVLLNKDNSGRKRLVAYYTAGAGQLSPSADQMRLYLTALLPDYMLPSLFIQLHEVPRTSNGKADREALEAMAVGANRKAERPLTPAESGVAEIWEELLGVTGIAPEDHFFELGGHSLLATMLRSRIKERLGVDLELSVIFEEPTLAGLVQRVLTEDLDRVRSEGVHHQVDLEGALS